MGQRSDEIKRQIDEKRSELSDNLEKLEERVKSTTDWRAQFDKRPMLMLGIAFGGGILASTLVPRASSRSRSSSYTGYRPSESSVTQGYTGSSESTGERSYGLRSNATKPKRNTSTSREIRKAWNTVDNIRASLVAYGSNKLREYLGSVIPGFDEIYRRTEEEHKGYQASSGMGQTEYSSAPPTPQI